MSRQAGDGGDPLPLSIDSIDLDALCPHETIWPKKQPFLASKGYHLRPRYQPDWVPSWIKDPTLRRQVCPDFNTLPLRAGQIDATTTDGRLVYLKLVRTDSEELQIARLFSSPLLRGDPRNHCVPILDTFPDNDDERVTYIVMPFLHPMDTPEFYWVGDIIDFVDQVFEGLAFMHKNGVAHRDCASQNIMMEATSLFPEGHHPVLTEMRPDLKDFARHRTRLEASPPVRYLFIDFGLSSRIAEGQSRLVLGVYSQDNEVPELSTVVPYDAFKLDVFILGNVLRRTIHDVFHRVEFLRPFIRDMTDTNPSARPDAEFVLARWKKVRSRIWAAHLIRRLRKREEGVFEAIVLDIVSMLKLAYLLAKRFAGWSAAWLRLLFCL